MTLQEDNKEGSDLHVTLNYFSLPVLDVSNDTDEQTFQTSYIEKNAEKEPDEGIICCYLILFVTISQKNTEC